MSGTPAFQGHALLRLEAARSSLRPSERRLCDYLLHHAEEVMALTISQIAAAAGVGDATVTRLCQSLGFRGFSAFRIALARESGQFAPPDAAGPAASTAAEVRERLALAAQQSLADTASLLDADALDAAAQRIGATTRIDIYGVGNSAAVAQSMAHEFRKLGIAASAISDIDMVAISSATLAAGDVALAVSHTGRTEAVVAAVEHASAGGAETICITHDPGSPLGQACGIVLQYGARPTPISFASHMGRLAQLMIGDMLCTIIAIDHRERSTSFLNQARAMVDARRLGGARK